jgi:hypothetical protein
MTFKIIDDKSRKISIKASGQNEIVLVKALETKMNAKTLITPPSL